MDARRRVLLAVSAVLLLTSQLPAQITFQRTYGGEDFEWGNSVAQTADGGYLITGRTQSFGPDYCNVWLIKTDTSGDTVWTRAFGVGSGEGYSVTQTTDSDYVITGQTSSFGAGEEDVWVIKTDASGDTIWTRTYGGTDSDVGNSVLQTADGGYVVAGWTCSFGADEVDFYLVRTDANGDTIWTRTYGGENYDWGYSVAQTTDGGFILAGRTKSFGAGSYDFYMVKTNAVGDTLWTRTYGGTHHDYGYSVALTADGGYVITGHTNSYGAGSWDAWLIKTDVSGDTLWTRTYGGTDRDEGRSVAQTADGGYIIAGRTQSFGAGWDDVWLIKADADGDTMWTRTFGGAEIDWGNLVAQTADGGYTIAGYTESFGAGQGDVWLIKTDSAGNVAIEEPRPPARHEPVVQLAPSVVTRGAAVSLTGLLPGTSIEILDASGRLLRNVKSDVIQTGGLSAGAYFLRLSSGQSAVLKKLLVVE